MYFFHPFVKRLLLMQEIIYCVIMYVIISDAC